MPSIDLRNASNQKVGDLVLDDSVFGERPKTHTVYEEVKRFLAAERAGTAATKTRGLVSGSGKKLWKQKGTGRARVGSRRSPIWRAGGTVHGPQPRSYEQSVPRKVRKLAMRVALSAKLKRNDLLVLEALEVPEPKTKQVVKLISGLALTGPVLFIAESENRNLRIGGRNLPHVKVVTPTALSVYDLLRYRNVVLTKATADRVTELFRAEAEA